MKERRSEEVAVQSTEIGQTLEEQGITVRTVKKGGVVETDADNGAISLLHRRRNGRRDAHRFHGGTQQV